MNAKNYINSVYLSFVPTIIILLIYTSISLGLNVIDIKPGPFTFTILVSFIFISCNFVAYTTLSSIILFKIYWRSAILTNCFLLGFLLQNQFTFPTLNVFGAYLQCLTFFHLSEFVVTALYNAKECSTDSFLLNHSMEYALAALASWFEFFIEAALFPQWFKLNGYTWYLGLFLIMSGELFRKLAMYTAGTNFNHYVQEKRQDDHILVTRGVYSFVRHPSYFGWFYWSIGTQILLANPICTILYAIASYKFFESRIKFEEFHLIKFFGKQYQQYQARVTSGIPFVKGFILVDENLD